MRQILYKHIWGRSVGVGVAKVGWVNVCGGKCWETVIRNPASDLLYCLKVSF